VLRENESPNLYLVSVILSLLCSNMFFIRLEINTEGNFFNSDNMIKIHVLKTLPFNVKQDLAREDIHIALEIFYIVY